MTFHASSMKSTVILTRAFPFFRIQVSILQACLFVIGPTFYRAGMRAAMAALVDC